MRKYSHHSEESKKHLSSVLKGHYVSDETRKKISLAGKGRKLSDMARKNISKGHIGSNTWSRGSKKSKEFCKKISKFLTGRKCSVETRKKIGDAQRGCKGSNWKGVINFRKIGERKVIMQGIEYRLWREAVFAKDNFTCYKCENRGGVLRAHYIKNFAQYPELRFALDNGMTFCVVCHDKFHSMYGRKNNTQEQIDKFLNLK